MVNMAWHIPHFSHILKLVRQDKTRKSISPIMTSIGRLSLKSYVHTIWTVCMAEYLCSWLQTAQQGQTSDNIPYISTACTRSLAFLETVMYHSIRSCVQEARAYGKYLLGVRVVARHGAVMIQTHTTGVEHHQPIIKTTWSETIVWSTLRCCSRGCCANLLLVPFRGRSASLINKSHYVDARRRDSRSASPKNNTRSVSPRSARPVCAETSSPSIGTSMMAASILSSLISYRFPEHSRCQTERLSGSTHMFLLVSYGQLQEVR